MTGFVEHPVAGVAILLWAADPDAPHLLATPFFHAAAAAAMELPVEVYFSAGSVRLLAPGVAESLRTSGQDGKTVLDAMREAHAHGAVFYACSAALQAHRIDPAAMIPECVRVGGAVQFMARAGDRGWRALVF